MSDEFKTGDVVWVCLPRYPAEPRIAIVLEDRREDDGYSTLLVGTEKEKVWDFTKEGDWIYDNHSGAQYAADVYNRRAEPHR